MRAVGTEIGFTFTLPRVSLSCPVERRSGRGVVLSNNDYSVPCPPGYTVRVTESPDYAPGTIVHISTMAARP